MKDIISDLQMLNSKPHVIFGCVDVGSDPPERVKWSTSLYVLKAPRYCFVDVTSRNYISTGIYIKSAAGVKITAFAPADMDFDNNIISKPSEMLINIHCHSELRFNTQQLYPEFSGRRIEFHEGDPICFLEVSLSPRLNVSGVE